MRETDTASPALKLEDVRAQRSDGWPERKG